MSHARYQNGLIYKIVSKDPSMTDCYVGSCCSFYRRKSQHKSDCNNEKSREYNRNVYKFIRKNGGWENWDMIEIKKYPCETKRELELEERKNLEELNATLNSHMPIRTHKEYYETNKEKICNRVREYAKKNKEHIRIIKKDYYEKNKEHISQFNKDYYEKNREDIIKTSKEYYEKNKEDILKKQKQKLKEKFDCDCGGRYTSSHKLEHFRTKKHQKFISKT